MKLIMEVWREWRNPWGGGDETTMADTHPDEYGMFVEWLINDLRDPMAIKWQQEKGKVIRRDIIKHLDAVKMKFPYDVFEVEDCREKLSLLDGVVEAFINNPTREATPSVYNLNELQFDPTEKTPYEKCAIEIEGL